MKYYDKYPDIAFLLRENDTEEGNTAINVNAHLHTPYSFSAFDNIATALNKAVEQDVKVVGINDFNTTDGYQEWADGCAERRLFPLFNIEFITLDSHFQANGVKVNDPGNPGRVYLSGKGLAHPLSLAPEWADKLVAIKRESNNHVSLMCQKLNQLLLKNNAGFTLDFNAILNQHTLGQARERHLAKMLRIKIKEHYPGPCEQERFLERILDGKKLKAPLDNNAALEIELRGSLLKSGGAAFVPESPEAFLEFETAREIILNAGGIPTYPFLADDANGKFTGFETDKVEAAETLSRKGICSVEFITTRNSTKVLEEYAGFFHDKGFIVTFGSEHNTPAMEPIALTTRDSNSLTPRLKEINLKGSCTIAAHQYLVAKGLTGYVDRNGVPDHKNRGKHELLGKTLITLA